MTNPTPHTYLTPNTTSSGLGDYQTQLETKVRRMREFCDSIQLESAPRVAKDWYAIVKQELVKISNASWLKQEEWSIPSSSTRMHAVSLASVLTGVVPEPPHVVSSPEGAVVFEWWYRSKKVTMYIEERTITYIKVWGEDVDDEMEDGETDVVGARKVLSWLCD